jgi:hypothetical protein
VQREHHVHELGALRADVLRQGVAHPDEQLGDRSGQVEHDPSARTEDAADLLERLHLVGNELQAHLA